ncbi:MAG: hypothetical protein MH825_02295 [Cyanobacteria bacterium]|nr:hypothetical protein [Cyanobacteriota bacterium]
MNSPIKTAHDEKIDSLVATYEQQGFTVLREPSSGQLPFDLGGYRPDLIATRGETGLIVEVKTTTSRISVDRFQALAQEISQHPGWRFLLVTLEDVDSFGVPTTDHELPAWPQLAVKLRQAQALMAEGTLEPALLYLWSIFEAALRRQAIEQNIPVERFPAPRLLNHLYSQGEISVEEIDLFQEFRRRRDRVAYGANESIDLPWMELVFEAVNRLVDDWKGQDSA